MVWIISNNFFKNLIEKIDLSPFSRNNHKDILVRIEINEKKNIE